MRWLWGVWSSSRRWPGKILQPLFRQPMVPLECPECSFCQWHSQNIVILRRLRCNWTSICPSLSPLDNWRWKSVSNLTWWHHIPLASWAISCSLVPVSSVLSWSCILNMQSPAQFKDEYYLTVQNDVSGTQLIYRKENTLDLHTKFSHSHLPPREIGITWSIVKLSPEEQYLQVMQSINF
jgi:hypothetical protein